MSKTFARVAATHPEDNSLDLVIINTGGRLAGVQLMTQDGSTRSGTVNLPEVAEPSDGKWGMQSTEDDLIAVVDYVDGQPIVTGFIMPQVNQMTFKDKRLKVQRHQSDFYHSIDGDGNAQWVHPSGTYFRIGEAADLDNLKGKDADGGFDASRNSGKKVSVRIGMGGGFCDLTISPDGAVRLVTKATVDIEAEGKITAKAPEVLFDTPLAHFTGRVTSDGDMVAGTVSQQNHVHDAVRSGPDTSGKPVA
jgi:phage baseplate assembly protein gpV